MASIKERAQRGEAVKLTDDGPIWVSRKDSDGMIYTISTSAWVHLAIAIAITLWSAIAVLAAVGVIGWGVVTVASWLLSLIF